MIEKRKSEKRIEETSKKEIKIRISLKWFLSEYNVS
jgi:hypothetical protein